MAANDFSKKSVPIIKVANINNDEIRVLRSSVPKINDGVYCISMEGDDWTNELHDGDILFVDSNEKGSDGDYVAIYPKDSGNSPFIEVLAWNYMEDCLGKEPGLGSNAIPCVSVYREGGLIRMIECSKLEKVHKVIGKASTSNHLSIKHE